MAMEDEDALPATKGDIRRLEKRLDGHDQRFIGFEQRFDGLEQRFDGLEQRFNKLEQKLDSSVARLDKKIDAVAVVVVQTQDRLRKVEEQMATKDDISRILSTMERFVGKYDVASQDVLIHGRSLTEVKVTLKDHEQRIARLEQ